MTTPTALQFNASAIKVALAHLVSGRPDAARLTLELALAQAREALATKRHSVHLTTHYGSKP